MKDVPVSQLEELYQYVQSLTPKTKATDTLRKKILSFAGAFSDMSSKDYADFLNKQKKQGDNLHQFKAYNLLKKG